MVCRVLLKTSALFRNFLKKIENHPLIGLENAWQKFVVDVHYFVADGIFWNKNKTELHFYQQHDVGKAKVYCQTVQLQNG